MSDGGNVVGGERGLILASLERHALFYGYRCALEAHGPPEEAKSRRELRAQAERRLLAEARRLHDYDGRVPE